MVKRQPPSKPVQVEPIKVQTQKQRVKSPAKNLSQPPIFDQFDDADDFGNDDELNDIDEGYVEKHNER